MASCVTERYTSTICYSQMCSQCGQHLQLPADAITVRCNECYTINPVRSHGSSSSYNMARVQDQLKKTAGFVQGYKHKPSTDHHDHVNLHSSSSSNMYSDQYGTSHGNSFHGYSGGTAHDSFGTKTPDKKPSYGRANSFGSSELVAHQYGSTAAPTSHSSYSASSQNAHHGTANSHSYGSSGSTHHGSTAKPHSYGSSVSTQHGVLGQTQYSHGSPHYARHGTSSTSTALNSGHSTHGSSDAAAAHEGAIVLSNSYGRMQYLEPVEVHHQNSYGGYTISQNPACPPVHGKKRAVLCGISYKRKRFELKGTVNDVNCMKHLLRDKFGFSDECIIVLTEDERNPSRLPTKQNIRNALRWLVHGSQSGDSLFFHYSGHGSQQVDVSGDEADGYDEALCPMDYETEGTIVDDEINETIVRPLPKGAKLHAVIDACHSGTVLDLPFVCKMNRAGFYEWLNESPPCTYKGTRGGLAISYTSCDDNQTSADTSAFSMNTTTDAMTYCFIQALESQPGLTYGRLLSVMRSAIRDAQSSLRTTGPIASLLRKMLRTGLTQEPQLCASERFDVYKLPFQL